VIEQAFGFDLSPLVARATAFERLAEQVRAEKKAWSLLREGITILRRDIGKTIALALKENLEGPWNDLWARFDASNKTPPRAAEISVLTTIATDLRALWADVDNALKSEHKTENMSGNDAQNERHCQSSKPNSFFDSEQSLRERLEEPSAPEPDVKKPAVRAFSLSLVLQACPDIAMYTKGGQGISTWRELVTAAGVVRGALGISPSAWDDACAVIGDEDAAIVIAAMLQRFEMIVNAGGYLRSLTERAREGKFSVGPMVMALLRVAVGEGKLSTGSFAASHISADHKGQMSVACTLG
jgi:replication initiation protein RepC